MVPPLRLVAFAAIAFGLGAAARGLPPAGVPPAGGSVTLTLDRAEVAGIAGFRASWDAVIPLSEDGLTQSREKGTSGRGATAVWSPYRLRRGQAGALAFDALERSALVRFPDAAERIARQVRKGFAVEKVELVLPFKDTELHPPGDTEFAPADGYLYRTNFGALGDWKRNPPRWHAVAWCSRRPWIADPTLGPTYNAYIGGTGYWTRYGAGDEKEDRFPRRFGPTEVSSERTEGRMDVTACLTDPAFGKTLAGRLRSLADNGFLLKKWELYDHRYYREVYEWATATGGRAILIRAPRLAVTFRAAAKAPAVDPLPPPVDVERLAARLRKSGDGGKPTAFLPTKEALARLAEEADRRPDRMPEWQWKRCRQLSLLSTAGKSTRPFWYEFVPEAMIRTRLGRPSYDRFGKRRTLPPTSEEVYAAWVDTLIARQPRAWRGFDVVGEMTQWYAFRHAMPGPARDAFRTVWEGWLLPDRPTRDLVHPMVDALAKKPVGAPDFVDSYYRKTGDWRGNKSFYRAGFNYTMSTQNFNTSSAAGALLGGNLVGSEYAMGDGRHGLEHYPLRLWAWNDGVSQENIDHYYFPITLSGQKAVADFGPTGFDRLMGASMLAKSMEEAISSYHPGLRRFTAPSSRTDLAHLLVTQEGLQYVLHTLDPGGALIEYDRHTPPQTPLFGREVPPETIARQTLQGPWAPGWMMNKPTPYEETSRSGDAWQRSYQGEHHGLASVSKGWPRVQILGHWRREPRRPEKLEDVVTMDVRYGLNQTRFANTAPGFIDHVGQQAVLQHRNKMIVATRPSATDWLESAVRREGMYSLQSSIGLFNSQGWPTWKVYLDGKEVTRFPTKAKHTQRITVHDGVSYLGVLPLPATDLGRTDEVVLSEGKNQTYGGTTFRAALVIDSYNFQGDGTKGAEPDRAKFLKCYGGFVVEMGDEAEYGGFEAFQKHFASTRLATKWDEKAGRLRAAYASGGDRLEGTFLASEGYPSFGDATVNGRDAHLGKDLQRDTSLAQQGRAGTLRKNGAALTTDVGAVAYLRTDPSTGTFMAWNPVPTPTAFALEVPGGVTVRSVGPLGMARIIVRPKERTLSVDYAEKPGEAGGAKELLVGGFGREPKVTLDGKVVAGKLATREIGGRAVYVVPLR